MKALPNGDAGRPIRIGAVAAILYGLPEDLQELILFHVPEPELQELRVALEGKLDS